MGFGFSKSDRDLMSRIQDELEEIRRNRCSWVELHVIIGPAPLDIQLETDFLNFLAKNPVHGPKFQFFINFIITPKRTPFFRKLRMFWDEGKAHPKFQITVKRHAWRRVSQGNGEESMSEIDDVDSDEEGLSGEGSGLDELSEY